VQGVFCANKPHKDERLPKFIRLKGLKAPRRLDVLD
jgi:hypothetical protein